MSAEPSPYPATVFHAELQTALAAVRQAAVVCRAVQSAISTDSLAKKDKSPVTVADFASQALICHTLEGTFPSDPVIGEEGAAELRTPEGAEFLTRVVAECNAVGVTCTADQVCDWIDRGGLQDYRPRFWTLDPIDGTKGFLRNEQYAISLALIVDGKIEVGVLGCPNMRFRDADADAPVGVLAWAVRGHGSWMQALDAPGSAPVRLAVTTTSASSESRFCESVESGHSSHDWSGMIASELGITREPYRIDSQCKYLAVARGDADLYLRLPTRKGYQEKIWDHAGGVLVVEEAGGRVTDIHGNDADFSRGSTLARNEGMVVTNGRFHIEVVNAVQKHAPTQEN
ncbi:MAG: 3'(2'),5'-bisphosphate nucleotidase [Planctomycetaceae bacterium]|nr:3'(2'),5'-bisphosphate nucleotidase [Planctomycetaceae bacterium]